MQPFRAARSGLPIAGQLDDAAGAETSPARASSSAAISAVGSISLSGRRSIGTSPSGMNFGCQAIRCLLFGRSFQRGLEVKYVYSPIWATRSPVSAS